MNGPSASFVARPIDLLPFREYAYVQGVRGAINPDPSLRVQALLFIEEPASALFSLIALIVHMSGVPVPNNGAAASSAN
jgi:hypothetical protein